MANLGTWQIDTKGEYVKLSEVEAFNVQTREVEQGITLTAGGTFQFQVDRINYIKFRVGELGLGTTITSLDPFTWTDAQDGDLYVCTKLYPCTINIQE